MNKINFKSKYIISIPAVLLLFCSAVVFAADRGGSAERMQRRRPMPDNTVREQNSQRPAIPGSSGAMSTARADNLNASGEKAYDSGNYTEALSFYEKAFLLCKELNNLKCIAESRLNMAKTYERLGDADKALSCYQESIAAAKNINDRSFTAAALLHQGLLYYANTGRFEKALEKSFLSIDESMKIFMDLNDRKSVSIAMFHLGNVMSAFGKYEDAAFLHKNALQICMEFKDSYGVVSNLNYLGRAYMRLGRYEDALVMLEQGLKISGENNLPQHRTMSLVTLGDLYAEILEYDRALPYYREALDLSAKLGLDNETHLTANNIAALYEDLNKYDTALALYEKALGIAKKMNQAPMIASTMNNIGNVYAALGDYDKALSYYLNSLEIDMPLQREHKISMNLSNIGATYSKMGMYEKAIHYLSESTKIGARIKTDNFSALNDLGNIYLKTGDFKTAEELYSGIGSRQGLVNLYILSRRYDEALSLLKEMTPKWNQSSLSFLQYHTLYAQALKGKGLLAESSQELLKAVSIAEETRQKSGAKEMFFAGGGIVRHITPYRTLVAVLSDLSISGKTQDDIFRPYGPDPASSAFYFSELARARTLLETMAGSARRYDEPKIPAEIKEREEYIQGELSVIESRWEEAYMKGKEIFEKLEKRKEKLLKDQALLESEITKRFPRYAALKYPKPVSLQNLPLKQNEILVEYAVGNDETYAFVIRKNGIRIHRLNIPEAALTEKIKSFMEPFNSGNLKNFSEKKAKELYDILLSKATEGVKPAEKLIIVPDGIIGTVPFEALVVSQGKNSKNIVYVGDKWTTSYYQSATALALTRQFKVSGAKKQFFALGNPVYSDSDPRYTAYRESKPFVKLSGGNASQYAYRGLTVVPKAASTGKSDSEWEEAVYPPLPETEEEIMQIAGILGSKTALPDVLLNISANETGFRESHAGDYRYLHFATHADMPGKVKGIREPFIILGQVGNKGSDDGFLTLSEVLELPLDADMVVLSACSTGKGRMIEGEGVANFARAFHHAGARSVVVSLWEVASEPAVEYMKKFYGHLKAGKSRSEALRLARNWMKTKYPNPFYWAVFILHGEG